MAPIGSELRRVRAALFAAVLALSCVPTEGTSEPRTLARGSGIDVELEPQRGEPLAHPAQVPAEAVTELLVALRYDRGVARGRDHSLFAPSTALALADAIARGLARAEPGQRVRFRVSVPEHADGPFYVPRQRHTRGVAFVAPAGVLNLAFDLVDEVAEGMPPAKRDPTASPPSRGVTLHAPAGAQLYARTGETAAPLWLTWTWAREEPEAPATAPTMTPEGEVLVRLRQLEELHRDGAISDAEYEKRKRALLFGDAQESAAQ